MDQMTDEQLMILYQKGDADAFEILFKRHKDKIYGYLVKRLKDVTQADEVFQNAFIKLHRRKELYDPNKAFIKFLYVVVRSEMLDYLRAKKISVEFDEIVHMPQESNEDIERVDLNSVDTLSEKEKIALSLRYYEEHEFLEIAQKLNTSSANARKIISRGIKKLKSALVGGDL
ncbi:MAG: sigma-70 family RNA polymerase sigma factor [Bacteriovoracaceae bacterium]|nr:sigma-70 family RNA polymerase sigma factor [Bacteriovoracaceae bacterium]